ncbi:MAG: TldD/PmbA family protein [Dehalococcoidia bacterium]|nr:MAG: TldD/PmbA family protein [Dehalococcoidia bacterium]
MEELLDLAKKVADEAEVFSISHIETDAVFEANRLKHVQSRESSGRALRIIKEGRIGFAASNKTDGAQELVDMALEMAPFGAEARFEFPQLETYPEVEVYDPDVEVVSEKSMVDLGQSLIDKVRGHTPELVCEASVSRGIISVGVFNSRGSRVEYRKSLFGFGLEGVLIRGTDMLFVGDSDSSCHPLTDVSAVIAATIEQLERARETAQAPVGQLPVIFTPNGVAMALMPPLAMAVNGKTVLQGASPLGQRKGEQVFDSRISVWDDATMDFRPGSRFCDGEGVPSQRTAIIENGVVGSFLYDLQTAALAGTRSTGNGARGLATLPSPSPSTVVIENGEASFEEMLGDIKEGLVVEQLLGAAQGNVLGGDFSGNILLGYVVRNGEIVGRVKDTMVSGNVYEVLKEVAAIESEGKWVGGRVRIPHIYCHSIAVSAKER